MRRLNLLWLLLLVVMAGQLVYLLVNGLWRAAGDPWLEVNVRPGREMIVAVPPPGQSSSSAAEWLTWWVDKQGGAVPAVQVQGQGRVVLHSRLSQHDGDATTLVLQLAPLRQFDPSLRGIRILAPRFLRWTAIEAEGISIRWGANFMGSVLTAIPVPEAESASIRLVFEAPLWPLLALLILSLAAGGLAFTVSQVLRLRAAHARQQAQYFGQIVPGVYVTFLLVSGYVPFLLFKVGIVLGLVLTLVLAAFVIAAGAAPLTKGHFDEVRFQLLAMLALQVLPMVAFLLARLSLLMGFSGPFGKILAHPIIDWTVDPALLIGLWILVSVFAPHLLGARRMVGTDLDRCRPLPGEINPRRLWLLQVGPKGAANAAAIGIISRWSHVLITDRLMQELSPSEVRAVLTHEAAHMRLRHLLKLTAWFGLLYYALRILAFVVGTTLVAIPMQHLSVGFAMFSIALFFLTSRWLSRQFELEADQVAVQEFGTAPSVLAGALMRLEQINGREWGRLAKFIGTHPMPDRRREALSKL